MISVLRRFAGTEGTLKRETVVMVWAMMWFIIVRVFAFTDPVSVDKFEPVVATIFWSLVLLLAGIFGVQVMAPWLSGGQPAKQVTIETEDAKLVSKTDAVPPKDPE